MKKLIVVLALVLAFPMPASAQANPFKGIAPPFAAFDNMTLCTGSPFPGPVEGCGLEASGDPLLATSTIRASAPFRTHAQAIANFYVDFTTTRPSSAIEYQWTLRVTGSASRGAAPTDLASLELVVSDFYYDCGFCKPLFTQFTVIDAGQSLDGMDLTFSARLDGQDGLTGLPMQIPPGRISLTTSLQGLASNDAGIEELQTVGATILIKKVAVRVLP